MRTQQANSIIPVKSQQPMNVACERASSPEPSKKSSPEGGTKGRQPIHWSGLEFAPPNNKLEQPHRMVYFHLRHQIHAASTLLSKWKRRSNAWPPDTNTHSVSKVASEGRVEKVA
ncbi:hypothetical protein BP6252_09539 [Coleophoma cylindrospora]|uniref:Uncharacterized protein n=1 Tax=Coleophoma cylindrospora TaxID=1849047 RepID=A0A3D8R276_9HELO|nr:hypothetical protein BP6252_09539 [Coleophoma cylindrospora]